MMFIMKALNQAISIIGGVQILAKELDLHPMAVYQWKKRGVPAKHVSRISYLTGHQMSCHDLRPDIFPNIDDS